MRPLVVHAWVAAVALMALAPGAASQARQEQKGAGFSDLRISERVADALNADRALRKAHIAIRTEAGVVHLRGFVDSLPDAQRAGALAHGVPGVSDVRNDLQVSDKPSRA
jgi:osmotically-inducible protein OsmY